MPRKRRFPNPTAAETNVAAAGEDNTMMCRLDGPPLEHVSHPGSSSNSGARASRSDIRQFRPPRDKSALAHSPDVESRQPPNSCPRHKDQAEVDNTSTEDEDYIPEADEIASFDDDIDNRFVNHGPEQENRGKRRKETDWWEVEVIEDGVARPMNLTVFEASSMPDGRKIVLRFNDAHQAVGDAGGLLSGFLGGLGADFTALPISIENWHKMKEYKEAAYNDVIKRIFHYEEDPKGRRKTIILQKLGKCWKDSRSNLFHTFYDDTKTIEENVQQHRPRGVDREHWRFFLMYRLKDETKEKCRKNAENRAKQVYTHTGGSMTLARRRENEERKHGKKFSRGEIWTITHKKSDGSFIHEDAKAAAEAIQGIENGNPSSIALSQNDSLAQVLGKEHPGRVRGMGAGLCPSQIIVQTTQETIFSSHVDVEEYKREIVELKVEAAVEKKKRQAMENVVRYLLEQQGGTLPPNIAAEMNTLGSGTSSADNQNHQG